MPIKHPKIKLSKMQQAQIERIKGLDTKETELNGNIPNLEALGLDEKRTDISKSSGENNQPKPRPKEPSKFPMEIGGGYAPEPYQFLPTFDEKELAKQYNVSKNKNLQNKN